MSSENGWRVAGRWTVREGALVWLEGEAEDIPHGWHIQTLGDGRGRVYCDHWVNQSREHQEHVIEEGEELVLERGEFAWYFWSCFKDGWRTRENQVFSALGMDVTEKEAFESDMISGTAREILREGDCSWIAEDFVYHLVEKIYRKLKEKMDARSAG